jgi:hypothetical protein
VISEYQIHSKFVYADTVFTDRHGENEYFSVCEKHTDLLKIIVLRCVEEKSSVHGTREPDICCRKLSVLQK